LDCHAARLARSTKERLNQLDIKVSRTFRMGRVSVLPVFEVFNLNNSDAIISYVNNTTKRELKRIERTERDVPGSKQHHAGTHVRDRSDHSLVGLVGPERLSWRQRLKKDTQETFS
jgi:hypothetical protein